MIGRAWTPNLSASPAHRAVDLVHDLLVEWTASRTVLTELAKGHPRDLCWICETCPRVTYTPGISRNVRCVP